MKQKFFYVLAIFNLFPYVPLSEDEQRKAELRNQRELYGMLFRGSLLTTILFIFSRKFLYVAWGLGVLESQSEVIWGPIVAAIGIFVSLIICMFSGYKSIQLFFMK